MQRPAHADETSGNRKASRKVVRRQPSRKRPEELTDLRPRRAWQELPLAAAVDHFFGSDGNSPRNENDQAVLLQMIDRYLEYCRGNGNGQT